MHTLTPSIILSWLDQPDVYGWGGVIAELLVVWVIWFELRSSRIADLMKGAFDSNMRDDLTDIYKHFPSSSCGTPIQRRELFVQKVEEKDRLRKLCDNQVVRFSSIWFLIRGQTCSRRRPLVKWAWPGRSLDIWFPHVVVPFWFIAGPYIAKRADMRGCWTAFYIAAFTRRSIVFLENQCQEIQVWVGTEWLTISKDHLAVIKKEVETIMETTYKRGAKGS